MIEVASARPSGLADVSGSDAVRAMKSVSALEAVGLPRHRWYFFKEAFSPEVVERAVADAKCGSGDLIVDPFCGSGTVPLQAAIDERSAACTEVNPFLAFVARTKVAQCSSVTLEERAELVARSATKGAVSRIEQYSTFSEASGGSRWLFNTSVLRAFEGGWTATIEQRGAPRDLLRLCLLGAAMDTANATKDGKCLRYLSEWKALEFDSRDFVSAFKARVKTVAADLKSCPLVQPDVVIREGDAREKAPSTAGDRRFKLCVTSPPYLNSFDYSDVYRPEMFLGRWVTDNEALRRIRLRTLRSHVQVKWDSPSQSDFGSHYTEAIKGIEARRSDLWNYRIPTMVQAYFEDMRQVLTNLRGRALPDATVWIVVSTSAYAGVEVPVDLIIADIASACGWYLREVSVVRYLGRVAVQQWSELSSRKNRKPHLRESLIILDASPRARSTSAGA